MSASCVSKLMLQLHCASSKLGTMRQHPWTRRPDDETQKAMRTVLTERLFLLQECGPTSFVISDDSNSKVFFCYFFFF